MGMLPVVSAIPEMLALILLLILLAFSMSDSVYAGHRTGLFAACLLTAILACGSRLAFIAYSTTADPVAETLHLLALLSQLFTPFSASLIFTYSLARIYAGSFTQRGSRIAATCIWLIFAVYAALCVTNHSHHLLFTLDNLNNLRIAPLRAPGKISFILQFCVVLVNYFIHRRQADHGYHHVMALIPLLGVAMAVFQAMEPGLDINNITLAFILLLLLVCCQRQHVNRDRLTSAGSREALSSLMQRMIAAHQPFTLQQVSLLHFRHVNRRHGLATGDALLQVIAHEIQRTFPSDRFFRFNGTDFVIFHDHQPDDTTTAQLAALRDRFTNYWEADNKHILLGASFAQVSYPQGGTTPEELINNLEYCQLQARSLPDNAAVIFDDNVRQRLANREHINELITSSLSTNRFFLCYQPIYDATGTNPCAAEALLRLRDEDGKIISPGVFIPAAEENGSIIQVTWMVLGKVCAFINQHKDEKLPPISINFSAQQFAEQDMCSIIKRYLDHYQVDPSQIKIEITERVFTEINDQLMKNIEGLQEMGVGLYLDDFGTGYSNLASVLNYPIEVVKVDKSLLSEDENSKANDLLQALVSGLKHLDVQVLIEGVETLEQSHRMQDIGVDRMQGFYYARPMEEKDFLSHMAAHHVA